MLKATREEIAIAPSNVKMRENVILLTSCVRYEI